MHPALSVIFFTTASGAGYGVLFLLALICAINPDTFALREALTMLTTGLLFSSAGLLSSMLHLGRPERAWRAFSQWRSSWLSREGVIASFGFLPALLLGFLLWRGDAATTLRLCAIVLAACAVATVFCTAKIYASLKTVHAWHNAYVVPNYLLLALLSGALWMITIRAWFSCAPPLWALLSTSLLLCGCLVFKLAYWRFIDRTKSISTAESATGLGRFGRVSSFERPHTEQNYLLKEMGYVLARKHSWRLRQSFLVLFVVSLVLLLLIPLMPISLTPISTLGAAFATLAALCITLAIFIERWLLFAEAKHLVTLYYDSRRS